MKAVLSIRGQLFLFAIDEGKLFENCLSDWHLAYGKL